MSFWEFTTKAFTVVSRDRGNSSTSPFSRSSGSRSVTNQSRGMGNNSSSSNPFRSGSNQSRSPFGGNKSSQNPFGSGNQNKNATNVFGGGSSSSRNAFSSNNRPNPFGSSSSSGFGQRTTQFSVTGKSTQNEKQIENVVTNIFRWLEKDQPENKFKEYLFNKYGSNVSKESRYQMKAIMDGVPYDEKYNATRRLLPDEDEYYMIPVSSFPELYQRKIMLNITWKDFLKETQNVKDKMLNQSDSTKDQSKWF